MQVNETLVMGGLVRGWTLGPESPVEQNETLGNRDRRRKALLASLIHQLHSFVSADSVSAPGGTEDTQVGGWPAPATHCVSPRTPIPSLSTFGVASTPIRSQVPFAEPQGTLGGKLPPPQTRV